MNVEFDEPTHTYRVGGVQMPSVTQILSDLSHMKHVDPADLAAGGARGRLIHQAVHYWNDKDLDRSTVDESIEPYLRAWERFCHDFEYEAIVNEHVIYSERWGYCGTFDTFGTLRGLGRRRPQAVIDVKGGVADPVHGPQTAAYLEPLRVSGLVEANTAPHRYVVRLQPNGFYQADAFFDPGDWSTFMAALVCHRFKERHKLL